jgi:hypothetical protein
MRKTQIARLYPMLQIMSRLGDEDRVKIIPFLNNHGCESIYECIHNGLRSKQVGSERRRAIRKTLKGEAELYRRILKTDHCPTKRQKRLAQVSGRGLGLILESVLPLLAQHLSATR